MTETFRQDVITLLDFRSMTPDGRFSPNTALARYCFKVKKIPFKVHWIELKDVQTFCHSIKASPTLITPDGVGIYTVPVIFDPKTQSVISDSFNIAKYLDKTYPDSPLLLPEGTKGLHRAVLKATSKLEAESPLYRIILPATINFLPETSRDYFRRTREAYLGKRLEDVLPTDEEKRQAWKKVKPIFDAINEWYEEEEGQPFIMGEKPCFADLQTIGRLFWLKSVFGEGEFWKDVIEWHNGRWSTLLQILEDMGSMEV